MGKQRSRAHLLSAPARRRDAAAQHAEVEERGKRQQRRLPPGAAAARLRSPPACLPASPPPHCSQHYRRPTTSGKLGRRRLRLTSGLVGSFRRSGCSSPLFCPVTSLLFLMTDDSAFSDSGSATLNFGRHRAFPLEAKPSEVSLDPVAFPPAFLLQGGFGDAYPHLREISVFSDKHSFPFWRARQRSPVRKTSAVSARRRTRLPSAVPVTPLSHSREMIPGRGLAERLFVQFCSPGVSLAAGIGGASAFGRALVRIN